MAKNMLILRKEGYDHLGDGFDRKKATRKKVADCSFFYLWFVNAFYLAARFLLFHHLSSSIDLSSCKKRHTHFMPFACTYHLNIIHLLKMFRYCTILAGADNVSFHSVYVYNFRRHRIKVMIYVECVCSVRLRKKVSRRKEINTFCKWCGHILQSQKDNFRCW